MEITGIIKSIGETIKVSDKFTKRELILTTEASSKYPQHLSIQLTGDKCNLLDHLPIGSELKVSINLRGREWLSPDGVTKYFNTIEAWKVESLGGAVKTPTFEPSGHNDDFAF